MKIHYRKFDFRTKDPRPLLQLMEASYGFPVAETGAPIRFSASFIALVLPTTKGRHFWYTVWSRRALAVTSGPIPAGSPIVMATKGF